MRTFDQLEQGWQATETPGRSGTVVLVVARLGGGEHEVLERGQLSKAGGLHGDRWSTGSSPSLGRQLTLMEARVADLVCDGQPLHMPGDNVLVDLDLSVRAAPTGTRIRLGNAIVVVTEKPHTGCKKFNARFGEDALRWVNDQAFVDRRLRGINCRVVEDGSISPGDTAEILPPLGQ